MTSHAKRILLVDDEESLRVTLAANLELAGFQVVEAHSGEQALQRARDQADFDVVLADIQMPGMDGIALFRELRRLHVAVPVIVMTAFAREELIQNGLREGVFTVLCKPFDVEQAVKTLTRAAGHPAVLVLDDVQNVAQTTVESLKQFGIKSQAVLSSQEAIELVREGGVDICVIDLIMPDVSGPEIMRRLREVDRSLSFIAVSGYDVPEMIRKAAAEGLHSFLSKPFETQELVRSIAAARGSYRA